MTIGCQDTQCGARPLSPGRRFLQATVLLADTVFGTSRQFVLNWYRRRELRYLYTFSNRELADIGIDRQDLNAAYYGPALQSPGEILSNRADERRRAERLSAKGRRRG